MRLGSIELQLPLVCPACASLQLLGGGDEATAVRVLHGILATLPCAGYTSLGQCTWTPCPWFLLPLTEESGCVMTVDVQTLVGLEQGRPNHAMACIHENTLVAG